MNDLLDRAVEAHGGLSRFNQFQTASAYLVMGGALWEIKGQAGVLNQVRVTVDLHQEHASFAPFKHPNQQTAFTPDRIAIETNEGAVVEERANPRAAFAGHTLQTPWDELHALYFGSYAMWTYLTFPFSLTWAGFTVGEIDPWQEQGETWRRLKVTFPPYIASHSTEQTFYIGDDGLLRRHDYDVEVVGNAPIAHYVSEYKDVSGFLIWTERRAFVRQPDNTPALDMLMISIDLNDIRYA